MRRLVVAVAVAAVVTGGCGTHSTSREAYRREVRRADRTVLPVYNTFFLVATGAWGPKEVAQGLPEIIRALRREEMA